MTTIQAAADLARTLAPEGITVRVEPYNDYRGVHAGERLVFVCDVVCGRNSKATLATLRAFRASFVAALPDGIRLALRAHKPGGYVYKCTGFVNLGRFDTTGWKCTFKARDEVPVVPGVRS